MSSLTITRRITRGTTPVDADTPPVLRDPTNAFGLRRDDTGEIIIAAGIALTRISTGVYQITAAVVPGKAYTYWRETIVGGVTTRDEKHYTAPATSSLPTYLGVDEADQLAASLNGLLAYKAATADQKLLALTSATMRVDNSRRWQGRKFIATQELEFPRLDGCEAIAPDPTTGLPTVPIKIKLATLLEADSILAGQRARIVEAQHNGLSEQEIGTAREQYAPPTVNGIPSLCKDAHEMAERYRLRSGRLL